MTYTLRQGSVVLAEISDVEPDMPWFVGRFQKRPAFSSIEHLFVREKELMDAEKWDEWEMLWEQIRASGIRLVPSDSGTEIEEFALHVEDDHCRFRY
jgi:hypothetical protein